MLEVKLGTRSFEQSQRLLVCDNASLQSMSLENLNFMRLSDVEVSNCPKLETVAFQRQLPNRPLQQMAFNNIPESAKKDLQRWCHAWRVCWKKQGRGRFGGSAPSSR